MKASNENESLRYSKAGFRVIVWFYYHRMNKVQ
jgi:hypothetical protein